MLYICSISIWSDTKPTVYTRCQHVHAHGDKNHGCVILKDGPSHEFKHMHSKTKAKHMQIPLRSIYLDFHTSTAFFLSLSLFPELPLISPLVLSHEDAT